jgi:uncharacterized membrane protein
MNEDATAGASSAPALDFHLVVATFDDPEGAARALAQVLAARREKQVAVPAVASVRKDETGTVEINEPGDVGAKEGAVAGGLLGGLLGGLFGRRALAGAALGAALGALGAEKHDAGIPNPRLREIGAGLPAGSSAFVAIVEESARPGLQGLLGIEESRITAEPIALDLDVARQLKEGQYGQALGNLADQAEGLIGEAEARVTEMAGSAAKQGKELTHSPAQPEAAEAPGDAEDEEMQDPTRG